MKKGEKLIAALYWVAICTLVMSALLKAWKITLIAFVVGLILAKLANTYVQ